MKSTYIKRNGHERTRHCHSSRNSSATLRRQGAHTRLSDQLASGMKSNPDKTGPEKIPLTENDVKRIKQELTALEEKL